MSALELMLAATYMQGGAFSIEEIARPAIERDEILLRIRAASICGTDVKIVRNGHRKLRDGQRIVLGHEFVGVIEQVGSDVSGYRAGDRIGIALVLEEGFEVVVGHAAQAHGRLHVPRSAWPPGSRKCARARSRRLRIASGGGAAGIRASQ